MRGEGKKRDAETFFDPKYVARIEKILRAAVVNCGGVISIGGTL
jgi:hypothetical protein